MVFPKFGRQKTQPNAQLQRDISKVFADLEAGDRLRELRKRPREDRRSGTDRRQAIQPNAVWCERRHMGDRRVVARPEWFKKAV